MNTLAILKDKDVETDLVAGASRLYPRERDYETRTYHVLIIPEADDGLEFFCFDSPIHNGERGFQTVMDTVKQALWDEGVDSGDWHIKIMDWWFMTSGNIVIKDVSDPRGSVCIEVHLSAKEANA